MNFFVPIIIIGLLIIITIILILFEQIIGGNAEKSVTINKNVKIPVQGDETVLSTLNKEKIFIPSACGGKATCGFCKFKLIGGNDDLKPTEEPFMSEQEKEDGIRLSCQVKVRGDINIEIPEEMMNAKEYHSKVVGLEDLTHDIKLLKVKLIEPDHMDFKPGQYAQLRVPGIEVIRAYSIASNPKDRNHLEFIIRMVPKGKATSFVHKALDVGDKLILTGPYGDFSLQEDSDKDIVCIAGGSGKAPIRSILSYLKDQGMPRNVKYFFGANTKKDLYYTEEFKTLEKQFPNFKYIPALSEPLKEDNWDGEVGLITDVVNKYCPDLTKSEAYLCGSPGMIDACCNVLEKNNINKEHIYFDKF